jgi:hypothetical protein
MREKPILFSAPMVNAIIEGRKTVTRRVLKGNQIDMHEGDDGTFHAVQDHGCHVTERTIRCPCGQPGDRLWVRETWRVDGLGKSVALRLGDCATTSENMSYRADMEDDRACNDCQWIPSIHMPRWASRITLEVTAVRVERLQAISEADARAEGIRENWCGDDLQGVAGSRPWKEELDGWMDYTPGRGDGDGAEDWEALMPRESFTTLWDSINAERGYGWTVNPWVWVVGFEVVEVRT